MQDQTQLKEPEILEVETIYVVGIKNTYTKDQMSKIPKQWANFKSKIITIPNRFGHSNYGVIVDTSDEGGMHYLTGVEVENFDDVPAGMDETRIDPQTYARFEHHGKISEIAKTWDAIFNGWFPKHREKLLLGVPMFERYGEDFDPSHLEGRVDIFIPIC